MQKVFVVAGVVTLVGTGAVFAQRLQQVPPNVVLDAREQAAPLAIRNQLTTLRTQIKASGRRFNVGYTDVLRYPLTQITGANVPKNLAVVAPQQNRIGNAMLQIDREAMTSAKNLPELKIKPSANLKRFDWRTEGKVTAIRNQSPCGTCWDFAPISALESSYLLRNNMTIDASEQQILDCAVGDDGNDAGKCPFPPGGWHTPVLEYLVSQGTSKESDYAYGGGEKACKANVEQPYRAVAWGFVTDEGQDGFSDLRLPTRKEMKQALIENGALAVTILATPAFQAYTGGDDAFKEDLSANQLTPTSGGKKYHAVNHVINIIGWDDSRNAWLIKNSWGTNWGDTCGFGTERGYGWVDYDSNNVGYAATWVRAKSKFYILPQKYFQIKPNIKPFVDAQITNQPDISGPIENLPRLKPNRRILTPR